MKGLTAKQQSILDFVRRGVERHGKAPSYRQIASHMGVTVNAITGHINALKKKGYVWRDCGVLGVVAQEAHS